MTPSAPAVPRGTLRRGFGVLWVAVREEPRVFAVSAAGSALFGLTTIAQAYVFGAVTERVIVPAVEQGRVDHAALAVAFLAIVGVATLKVVGILARRLGAGIMQYRLQAAYRRRVTRRYLQLPLSWHQQHPTGQLLSNAGSDVEATWYPIAPFPFAVGVVFMLVVSLGLLLGTDPVLALVGSVVFPAIAWLTVVYSRRMSPLMTRAQHLRAEVSGIAHESFDGALVVKTLGREASETERFGDKALELRDVMTDVGRVRGLYDPLMESLPTLGVLVVLWVGTSRVGSGALDAGELVRVAYLFTLLAFPVRALGWVLNELPRSVVGWDRVQRVLRAEGDQRHGEVRLPATSSPTALHVAGVSFRYGGHDVLSGVAFTVDPGRTVAVVGSTGAGKSTLASLLVRLLDPVTGAVTYDDVDVRELAPGAVADVAALVPQTTFLFDDTVRSNVTLGADLPDEEVWAALRLAQADGFVAALHAGLDTVVGERGTTLSGGQRQRLALARALVRRPRLLVLDDATSSVDPRVEQRILAGLREAVHDDGRPSTVVVVAHRRATIALADEVVVVERGRVVDRGSHEQLLQRSAAYADLVKAYERAEAERAALAAGSEVGA
ncbi:MAG TPA: ABC transporter ATP-binding protein [Mycobacteriales bacterium]|nr:ABC transporter ATP-binding protein [Mycobacteriales bacterium]